MKRRDVMFAATGGLAVASFAGMAAAKTARIGILSSSASSARQTDGPYAVFLETLAKAGWIEGRNLVIDWRYADGDLARHVPLAAELAAMKPDLILASTQPSALATMSVTKTIPIVFMLVHEPVSAGLADSLARPGRNATGLTSMNVEILSKRLELLLEVVPSARRLALLHHPDFDLNLRQVVLAEPVLQPRGVKALRVAIGHPDTFDTAFDVLARELPDAVLVIENPSVFGHRAEIARRMAAIRLPAMYGFQPFTLDGGLMSYSIDFADQFRRAAVYVDRILRGAKPGELPIEPPLRLELTVNLKAAKALGIAIPHSVILRADRLIE